MIENKIVFYEFGGLFKKDKKCANGPKVTFLLTETYFLVHLGSEQSPAARRCACSIYIQDVF